MRRESTSSQVAGLHYQILDTDARIDRALDRNNPREFRLMCRRRASLAARLQTLLLAVVLTEVGSMP